MHSWKLILTALGTGALLGTIGGTTLSPTLKAPPEQPWRQGLGPQDSSPHYDIVEAAPQDLAPQGYTYGAGYTFPEEHGTSGARRSIGYRYEADMPPQPDESWSYAAMSEEAPAASPGRVELAMAEPNAADAIEAAEAARDAAQDAADQGLQPVAVDLPSI